MNIAIRAPHGPIGLSNASPFLSRAFTSCLSVTNLAEEVHRFGLGFHPYFPRDESVTYRGLHKGEWTRSAEGLPMQLDPYYKAIDWWTGRPVGSRTVDTNYVDRSGPLSIEWPDTAATLLFLPSDNLSVTTVDTPPSKTISASSPRPTAPTAPTATLPKCGGSVLRKPCRPTAGSRHRNSATLLDKGGASRRFIP